VAVRQWHLALMLAVDLRDKRKRSFVDLGKSTGTKMLLKPLLEYLTPISVFGFAGVFFSREFLFHENQPIYQTTPNPCGFA
jgi:hypothetical protein